MTAFGSLLALALLLLGRRSSSASAAPRDPYRRFEPTAARGGGGGGTIVPASYTPASAAAPSGRAPSLAWVPYVPTPPEIVSRAQELLHDRSVRELTEPDPTRAGELVRYVRTVSSAGRVNVSAWRRREGATVRA